MADNLTAPAAGAVLATDDVGGVHYPRTKIAFGVDGAATDVSTAAPFPVALDGLGAVDPTPAANTVLGRLKAIADAVAAQGGFVDGLEALATALNGYVDGLEALLTAGNAAQATAAKQDSLLAAVQSGTEYETVAASATNQTIGATGAAGDLLNGLLIIPATTSPGAVSIKDGGNAAIPVFAGGASSVGGLVPFFVPLGIRSASGAWQVTTGANVSAIAMGDFT